MEKTRKVAVIMGSDSDLPIAGKAITALSELGIPYTTHVFSAHRTPEQVRLFASGAREAGYGAIIAIAGMAAHLAGAVAAQTTLPVIGIPVCSGKLGGIDALLSTVMMPPGIPVASVGIDAGANAALLAAQIIAVSDDGVAERLGAMRRAAAERVLDKDSEISAQYSADDNN